MCHNFSFAAKMRRFIDRKFQYYFRKRDNITVRKVFEYRVFSSPCFYVLGLNTVIYSLNLCIQSEFGKIRTKKTSYLNFSLCNVWNKEALSFRVVSDWKSYNKYFLTFVWVGSWSWEGDLVVFTFEIRNEEGIW